MMRISLLIVLLCMGCAAKEAETTVVPLTEVAPNLLQAAKQALPSVKFSSARRVQLDGEDVYEIRGTMPNGKVREVNVAISGKVLDVD